MVVTYDSSAGLIKTALRVNLMVIPGVICDFGFIFLLIANLIIVYFWKIGVLRAGGLPRGTRQGSHRGDVGAEGTFRGLLQWQAEARRVGWTSAAHIIYTWSS